MARCFSVFPPEPNPPPSTSRVFEWDDEDAGSKEPAPNARAEPLEVEAPTANVDKPTDGLDDGSRLRRDRPMRGASTAYSINETWHFEDTASRGLDLARRRGAVVPESGRAN